MTQIKIAVQGQRAALLSPIELIAGTVGQKCKFYFDDDWKQMSKTITYRVGSTIIASESFSGDEVVIPPNVFLNSGLPVEIGLTARDNGNTTTVPTAWCLLGYVMPSAFGNVVPTPGTQIIYDGGVIT